MTGSYELQHADGTTTVIEVDDSGNYYVYTTDSSTGERIDNAPSSEIGSNYTLDEVLDSYRREDDVPPDATPEEQIANPDQTMPDPDPITSEPDPAMTEPEAVEPAPAMTEPGAQDLEHSDETTGSESDSGETSGADGG